MNVVMYDNRQLSVYGDGLLNSLAPEESAVTIGSFDGVHRGHRKIISGMLDIARFRKLRSVVVTFDPHPRRVLTAHADVPVEILTTLDEKIEQMAGLGVDLLFVVRFTSELAAWSSGFFIEEVLVRMLHARNVVVGYDHGFGRNRSGSGKTLSQLGELNGFQVDVIDELRIGSEHISSTKIRALLKNGSIRDANAFLGVPYVVSGRVTSGKQLGRLLGFPTVNLMLPDPQKLLPRSGVYMATTVIDGEPYRAMMNIGSRPTVSDESGIRVEAHILGYSGLLYGRRIRFSILGFIREEKKFNSLDLLREQLEKDKKTVELFCE